MRKIFSVVCEFCFCVYFICLIFGESLIDHKDLAFLIMFGVLSIINRFEEK